MAGFSISLWLAARAPASLAWGQGRVDFAANRRVLKDGRWAGFGVNPNGPTDHSLPVLRATGADGKTKSFTAQVRIDTPQEVLYYKHGGILQYVLRQLVGQK